MAEAGKAVLVPERPRRAFYGADVENEIIERLEDGQTLTSICRKDEEGNTRARGDFPTMGTVYDWADPAVPEHRPLFAQRFARARLRGLQVWHDECIDIANTPEAGIEETIQESTLLGMSTKAMRKDMLAHRALKIRTRQEIAARMQPQVWAERLQQPAPPPQDDDSVPGGPNTHTIVVHGGLPEEEPPPPPEDDEPAVPAAEPDTPDQEAS